MHEFCESKWIKRKNLNQVLGSNKNNIKKLNDAGVYNYVELSKLDKKKIEGLKDETKIKLIDQAKLQIGVKKKDTKIFKIKEENKFLKKGFNLLPEPSCDLFFDIEGVQDYVFSGRLEYLFGIFLRKMERKYFGHSGPITNKRSDKV